MNIKLLTPQNFSLQGTRQHQEDCLCPKQPTPQSAYFAVCDGVGGRACGEVASQLVCDAIEQNLTNEACAQLRADGVMPLIDHAYTALYNHRAVSPEMATTLAFLANTTEGMLTAHLGDSRIYQFRPDEGIIFQTSDHSLVQDLLNKQLITPTEAESHPKKHVITKCLFVTGKHSERKQPTLTLIRNVRAGDLFLLCTDGVYGHLGNNTLSEIITSPQLTLAEKAQELARLCQTSSDNSTAFLLEVAQVEGSVEGEDNVMFTPTTHKKSWFSRLFSHSS